MESILGKASEQVLTNRLEDELVKKAKIASRNLDFLKKIIEVKKKYTKGKITKHDIAEAHRAAYELTNALLEHIRRQELLEIEKRRIVLAYKAKEEGKEVKKRGEIILFKDTAFVIPDINTDIVKKWSDNKFHDSSREDLKNWLAKKETAEKTITPALWAELKKLFGEFELLF